ncbi:MAG: O-antigen ligase family protein [Candidatus Rokubacteria bacterium]|nr:O-antigen ligase family protein [Candidatus Rokubacteria bacterium]
MRMQAETATAGSLLAAVSLAVLMSAVLAKLSVPAALGVGLSLAVLIIAAASNELALYLLIFSMLLGPEVILGELGAEAGLGRGLTFRLDDLLLAVVGLAWLGKTALYKELGLLFRTPLNRQIAAYTFAAFFATGLGMILGQVKILAGALFVLKYVQYVVIYFMVVNNLRERRQYERFLVALLSTAAVSALIGILQIPSGGRVSAPFEGSRGEPNTFGGYLVLMLAVVAGLYLTSDSLRRKVLLAGSAALILLPLLFTLSRASYLALIALAGALFAWSERKRFLAALFALALALLPVVTPKAVVDRVLYTITQPFHSEQVQLGEVRLDTSTSARLRDWRQAFFEDWTAHPLFGYGVTGYRFIDAQYPRVLVETGLVGLSAFLWLQFSLLRQTRSILKTTRDPLFKGVALGFLAGLVALVAHSIGANTFIIVRIMEPFWFLAGMVVMIPEVERLPPAPASRPEVRRQVR